MKETWGSMEQSKNNTIIAGAIVIAAVVLIAFAASIFSKPEETTQNDNTAQPQTPTDSVGSITENTGVNTAAAYKSGTYVTSDKYSSPGGIEDIKVTLTLENNTVTDVQVAQEANNDESAEYQQKFHQSYKSKVIGKDISSLELSRSSGASLTTNAFNDALEEIRNQAKAK